jgi:hypothetical protein
MRSLLVTAFLLVPSGCHDGKDDTDPATPSGPYDLPSLTGMPEELTSGPITAPDGGMPVEYDPDLADAITAWADCAGMLGQCLDSTSGDFDTCVAGVPTCTGATPWEEDSPCCAEACVSAYQAARTGGASDFDAFIQVFAIDPACMPGLEVAR